jgi:hypothetical protein
MHTIVFLFGAGASFGAGGILPEPPPLGAHLFSILEQNYPGSWGSLPAGIKATLRRDFENGMLEVHDSFGVAIPSLMREMAIYFIQFRPASQSSLYCRLIQDLARVGVLNRTLFSTLNYECVLEFSLLNQGYAIDYFGNATPPAVHVQKFHGSCNMFSQTLQVSPGIIYSTGITFEGGIEAFLDPNLVIQRCLTETALAPVMCLYMRGKPVSVAPSIIQDQQHKWAASVYSAKAIVCIGIRLTPADVHLWEPLAKTAASLYFIGNAQEFNDWSKQHRPHKSECLGSRFAEAYPQLIDRIQAYATLTS